MKGRLYIKGEREPHTCNLRGNPIHVTSPHNPTCTMTHDINRPQSHPHHPQPNKHTFQREYMYTGVCACTRQDTTHETHRANHALRTSGKGGRGGSS